MKLLLIVLGSSAILPAQPVHLEFEPAQSKIEYTVDSTLHTVHGTFDLKRGVIDYDTSTGKAAGELIIDAASGKSGSGGRDGRMHSAVLDSAKFPEIRFVPDRVEGQTQPGGAESEVKLHGQFWLHGATHEMTIPAKVRLDKGRLTTTSTFQIPYVQWGLKNPGNFLLKVGDQVQIHIEADAKVAGK